MSMWQTAIALTPVEVRMSVDFYVEMSNAEVNLGRETGGIWLSNCNDIILWHFARTASSLYGL